MTLSQGAPPIRIAMWSGPRNISTAMMRSFENRPDTAVWDEPFYAAYLKATELDHPMRAEVIAAGETDPDRVAAAILGPVPGDALIYYQKHMSHHMLPSFSRDWIHRIINCFLIRKPDNVVASYAAKRQDVELPDIGFVQQAEIFDEVADRLGNAPPVLDARDVLEQPDRCLRALCTVCGITFMEEMLRWPPGQRDSDGAWAPHWYGSVEQSTGFGAPNPDVTDLPANLARIADAARPYYQKLAQHRLGL